MRGISIFGQLAPILLIALGIGYLVCYAASNMKLKAVKIGGYAISSIIILISLALLVNAIFISNKISEQLTTRARRPIPQTGTVEPQPSIPTE